MAVKGWEDCYVISFWPNSSGGITEQKRFQVSGKSNTIRVTREQLQKGYMVAWSTVLADKMERRIR